MKTVSLQTAKALVEAGVVIESERVWVWIYTDDIDGWMSVDKDWFDDVYSKDTEHYPAPDTDELLKWFENQVCLWKIGNTYFCEESKTKMDVAFKDTSPAEALAQLALHLKKEGLV